MTEVNHSKINLNFWVICDASKEELGAILQQKREEVWEIGKQPTTNEDFSQKKICKWY